MPTMGRYPQNMFSNNSIMFNEFFSRKSYNGPTFRQLRLGKPVRVGSGYEQGGSKPGGAAAPPKMSLIFC